MEVGSATDIGLVRHRNEDDLLTAEDRATFVVADGLGGHPAGDVASRIVIETLDRELTPGSFRDGADRGDVLADALRRAHHAIIEDVARSPERAGMGTTAVLAHIGEAGDEAWIAHVGDSRAYLARDDQLRQVTHDDRSAGVFGGRITQALGISDEVDPEVIHLDLRGGDRLILCTDGLSDVVDEGRIEQLATAPKPAQETCDSLIAAANAAGGIDNITVIVVDVNR